MEKFQYKDQTIKGKELAQRFEDLARLYAEVFADPPWNEFTRSIGCNSLFGRETQVGDICPNCGDLLTEAFQIGEVIRDTKTELSKPDAILVTREEDGKLIAFAWGFSCTQAQLIDKKYQTQEMKSKFLGLLSNEGVDDSFFYFSEIGVSPLFRNQGLSNELSSELVNQAASLGKRLIMRTNFQSPMVRVAQRFGMKQIMGPSPTGPVNFIDTENMDRVLFIK